MTGYGPHLMIDLDDCDPKRLMSLRGCKTFLDTLPVKIDMHIIRDSYVMWYDPPGNERDAGVTGFVVIAESHISIHTYPKKKYAFVDIFSCRPFDIEKTLKETVRFFGSKKPSHFVQLRGGSFPRN